MVERSTIDAYAAMGADQALQPFRYPSKDLAPLEVEIAVTHCGICHSSASPGEVRVSAFVLLDGQKSIGGSAVGANVEIREMLKFSAAHDIKPMIELFAMNEVNLALDRVRHNDMRYRAVVVNEN